MATTYRYLAAILSMMTILGCSGEPEIVYVPGEGFQESIHVATEQGPEAVVEPGERLTLHVTRRSTMTRADSSTRPTRTNSRSPTT